MRVRRLQNIMEKMGRKNSIIEKVDIDDDFSFAGGRVYFDAGVWVVTEATAKLISKFFGLKERLPAMGYELALSDGYTNRIENRSGRYFVWLNRYKACHKLRTVKV